jgi:hypothetical protein
LPPPRALRAQDLVLLLASQDFEVLGLGWELDGA